MPIKSKSLMTRVADALAPARPVAETIGARLAASRATGWRAYRDAVTRQADGAALDQAEVDTLAAAMATLAIAPADMESDVKALVAHRAAATRRDRFDYDARLAEARSAQKEIDHLLLKRLPELRATIATCQALLQAQAAAFAAVADIERGSWRQFSPIGELDARSRLEAARRDETLRRDSPPRFVA